MSLSFSALKVANLMISHAQLSLKLNASDASVHLTFENVNKLSTLSLHSFVS